MAEPDEEVTIVRPGGTPEPYRMPGAPGAGPVGAGPTPNDLMILPPDSKAGQLARSGYETTGDPQTIAMRAMNQGLFGIPNRVTAAKRALFGESGSYGEALEGLNRSQEDVRKEYPWTTGAADAVAGTATGLGAARGGATLARPGMNFATRAGAGAVEGGLWGGLHGAGTTYSDDLASKVHGAGMGAMFGMGLGVAAPAVGATVGAGQRALADRGWFGGMPDVLVKAAEADRAGLGRVAMTPGAMLPDAGPSMLGTAQGSVLGAGGEGKTALTTNLRARDDATGARITGHINQDFGPARPPSQAQAEIQTQINALSPHYERVLNSGHAVDTRNIANDIETQIINSRGQAQQRLRDVRAMLDIPTNPGHLDPHPRAIQAARSAVRGMRDDINNDDNTRRAMRDVYDQLTRELQVQVPGIRELDHQRAELGSQMRAAIPRESVGGATIFDSGRRNAMWPEEMLDTMTGAVQPKGVNVGPSAEGFRLREAARAELERIVGTSKNDLLKLENVLGQPQDWNQQKLRIMFGEERGQRLMDVLARERGFRQTYQDVTQGSQTATRTAAKEALEEGAGKIPHDITATALALKTLQSGWDAMRSGTNTRQRDRIAGIMAERDPAAIQRTIDDLLTTGQRRDVRQEMARRIAERAMISGPVVPLVEPEEDPRIPRIRVTPKRKD